MLIEGAGELGVVEVVAANEEGIRGPLRNGFTLWIEGEEGVEEDENVRVGAPTEVDRKLEDARSGI